MTLFKEDIILQDLNKFLPRLKSDYEIEEIEIMNNIDQEKGLFGYFFTQKGKKFKAYLSYKRINHEFEVPDENLWTLEEKKNDEYDLIGKDYYTLGAVLDNIFELTE